MTDQEYNEQIAAAESIIDQLDAVHRDAYALHEALVSPGLLVMELGHHVGEVTDALERGMNHRRMMLDRLLLERDAQRYRAMQVEVAV
jgi:hypothetical protein